MSQQYFLNTKKHHRSEPDAALNQAVSQTTLRSLYHWKFLKVSYKEVWNWKKYFNCKYVTLTSKTSHIDTFHEILIFTHL